MILDPYKPRVVFQFYYLYEVRPGVYTYGFKAGMFNLLEVLVVEFITVPMAFMNKRLTVGSEGFGSFLKLAIIGAQTHRAAFIHDFLVLLHHVNDGILSLWIQFRRTRF